MRIAFRIDSAIKDKVDEADLRQHALNCYVRGAYDDNIRLAALERIQVRCVRQEDIVPLKAPDGWVRQVRHKEKYVGGVMQRKALTADARNFLLCDGDGEAFIEVIVYPPQELDRPAAHEDDVLDFAEARRRMAFHRASGL